MGYATAQWITRNGATKNLDAKRMAVAGESVGGNMTAALALMAKERGDVTFMQQSMYYPVTDAAMETASYEEFATGYYLTRKAMEWFSDAYTTNPKQRSQITASPNQATVYQVTGLPPTYLCVDEANVLRDEGQAYAAKLRSAGVAPGDRTAQSERRHKRLDATGWRGDRTCQGNAGAGTG
jgi:acetyl esterase